MEKITSRNNDYIKDIKKLISSSGKRRQQQRFVLEGARLCFDVLHSFYEITAVLITEKAYEKYDAQAQALCGRAQASYLISDEVAQKLSDTENAQGVFAVCKMKPSEYVPKKEDGILILDRVQDPGNLGTILRTAEALGIAAVYVCGGCDIYNPKVIRATMGSFLRLPVLEYRDAAAVIDRLHQEGIRVYATVPDEAADDITALSLHGCACVIGNEANGIGETVLALCDGRVTIRMRGNAESLNASVAAAITMWEMLR